MNRHVRVFIFAVSLCLPLLAIAKDKPASSSTSTVRAELTKPLDAAKAKVGDAILVKTRGDIDVAGKHMPKGSTIVGQVVRVQKLANNNSSLVQIAFDRGVLKDGTEVRLHAIVEAAGAPVVQHTPRWTPSPTGGPVDPATPPSPMPFSDAQQSLLVSKPADQAPLMTNAHGAWNLPGLSLAEGVFSAKRHEVQLVAGTQLILKFE